MLSKMHSSLILQQVVRIFTTLFFKVRCPTLVEICRNSMKLENSLLCNAVYFSVLSSAISVAQAWPALHLVLATEVKFGLRTENMKLDKQEVYYNIILTVYFSICGPGSSVGIATDYGLDGPGSNAGGDEIFRPSRPALWPTQHPVQWVPGLSRG